MTPVPPPTTVDGIVARIAAAHQRLLDAVASLAPAQLQDVQAALAATQRRLLVVVASLTLDDVFDPAGLSALLGEPFAPMLLGAYEHYAEHAEE